MNKKFVVEMDWYKNDLFEEGEYLATEVEQCIFDSFEDAENMEVVETERNPVFKNKYIVTDKNDESLGVAYLWKYEESNDMVYELEMEGKISPQLFLN